MGIRPHRETRGRPNGRTGALSPRAGARLVAKKRIIVAVLVIASLGTCPSSASNATVSQPSALTVTPTLLAAGAELANPFRGSYLWQGVTPQPSTWPMVDSYKRITWRELEPSQGHYNFARIDTELAAAKARGGRFGFRIQSACTGCTWSLASPPSGILPTSCNPIVRTAVAVPDYLAREMKKGWCFPLNGTQNYAPDWNDRAYLDRLDALLHALGARYDRNPRLGWVDISSYGDWGEWHVYQWPYPASTGATPITLANGDAIVDMNHAAFPHKTLVSLTQTTTTSGDHGPFLYALNKYRNVGIRLDCFGGSYYTAYLNALYKTYSVVANRWKTAPFIGEYCGGGLDIAYTQIKRFHVAMMGNGNVGRLSGENLRQFEADNTAAGYRFVLRSLRMPGTLTRRTPFTLKSVWSNVGVTPAYSRWRVTVQLRRGSRVAWAGVSKLNLRSFLPGGRSVADHFVLPATLKAGTYSAVLTVVDPTGYSRPLRLAITGRTKDGSYALGAVSVR